MQRRPDDTSDLPAAARQHDGHTHPLTGRFRVLLLSYGLVLGLALTGLFGLYRNAQDAVEQRAENLKGRTEQLAVEVRAELDRRTASRDAESAALEMETARLEAELEAQSARTRQAVCVVLLSGDLGTSPRLTALAEELQCR